MNAQPIGNPDGSGAVFRERSALLTLVSTVAIYGAVLALAAFGPPLGFKTAALLALGVGLQVACLTVGHVVLALTTPNEPNDERDRDIERRAAGPAHWIASAGLVLGLILLIAQQMASEAAGEPLLTRAWTHPMWAAQLLLLALVLSEGLRLGLVVRGYRRG